MQSALRFASRGLIVGIILVCQFLLSAQAEIKLSPQWTERYLFKHHPILVKNSHTDHVIAFYYFGSYKDYTIMGMERVKGNEYEPHNTILVFKDSVLQGYYEELAVFPAGVSAQGIVYFPSNRDVIENINLENNYYPEILFKAGPDTGSQFNHLKPL